MTIVPHDLNMEEPCDVADGLMTIQEHVITKVVVWLVGVSISVVWW